MDGNTDTYEITYRLKTKSGKWKWVLDKGKIIETNHAGKPIRVIGLQSDIDRQKESENEIKDKNQELQKVNAEKDKFYSIIAHDLHGPMCAIMGMTEMLADEALQIPELERKELSSVLSRSARNTFTLLEQLLEWSRIENKLSDFKPQNLILRDIVDASLKIVSEPARGKGVELKVEIFNESVLFGDLNMLQTVIRNLLSNAIKFSPPGGEVTISSTPGKNNSIVIAVKDTGIGMPDELVEKLFKADAKIKRPGTNGEHSTGLGLLLCKEFIEKHGSKIDVESEEGKGSVFSFSIPCSVNYGEIEMPDSSLRTEVQERTLNNLKVIIAEDDIISGKLIMTMIISQSRLTVMSLSC